MPTYRTPDVYVEEISVFPPSVAEVETAIPAFIGYTERARKLADGDLVVLPTKVYSLKEFEAYYGGPQADPLAIRIADDDAGGFKVDSFTVNGADKDPLPSFLLYYAVKMFFDNGGGKCYIVSVGDYTAKIAAAGTPAVTGATPKPAVPGLLDGLAAIALEDEPTMLVVPEAVKLTKPDYISLVQAMLLQCGGPAPQGLHDRFAIFDLREGTENLTDSQLSDNRACFGNNYLSYGAAYYPFLRTTLNYFVKGDETNVAVTYVPKPPATPPAAGAPAAGGAAAGGAGAGGAGAGGAGAPAAPAPAAPASIEGTLNTFAANGAKSNTAVYNFVKAAMKDHFVKVPPSGAVAGVYAATDTARGVWKAPANVSVADVIEPLVRLDNAHQDSFNVDANSGKSINALRAFAGKGTLVWGARTLDGNSNEWRYVPVRRFFLMVEESVKKSTYWAVFEPNDANTWVKVRGMIENYLTQKWREGALAGATTKDAFFVKCGIGVTMTAQDILEGRMNVEIGMAVVRPAEFIILKFSHKLQTS